MKLNTYFFSGFLALLFASFHATGATTNWTGGTSSSWNLSANWDNGIPGSGDDAVITTSGIAPVLDVTATVTSLTIDNGATLTLNSSSFDLTVTGNISGQGTLSVTGSSSPTITVGGAFSIGNFNADQSTVVFNGSSAQSISNASGVTFYNLQIDNSDGVSTNAGLTINNHLSGLGELQAGSQDINVLGDLTLATYTAGTSTFIISGVVTQNINSQTFYNFTAANNANLTGSITVTNQFDFDNLFGDWTITLNAFNVTIESSGSVTNYGEGLNGGYNYFVTNNTGTASGFLIQTATTNGLDYPIGTSTSSYTPITIDPQTSNAVFYAKVKPDVTDDLGIDVTTGIIDKTWMVQTTGVTQNVQYAINWFSADEQGTPDRDNIYISSRTTDPTGTWDPSQLQGASGNGSGGGYPDSKLSGDISTATGAVTTYIATGSNATALPVRLIYFNASLIHENVQLTWETAMEDNNSHFEIERSSDGKTWSNIGRVEGHGTSFIQHSYEYSDFIGHIAPKRTLYYRLKQVDFNGTFEYSTVRAARFSIQPAEISYYPNPVRNILNITTDNKSAETLTITIDNILGTQIYIETVNEEGAFNRQIDLTTHPEGTYILQITNGSETTSDIIYKK